MGHRRDVYGGDLRAGAASGSGRRTEPSIGGAGVWCLPQDDSEDADVLGSAGLSAATADTAAQAGALAGRDRRHSERGQDAARQPLPLETGSRCPARTRRSLARCQTWWLSARQYDKEPACQRS